MVAARGQVSVEYILVVGFAMLMITPLIFIFYSESNNMQSDISNQQADKIANELVKAADQVYFQGPPTTQTIKIYMPENVKEVVVGSNYIKINTQSSDGIPRTSAANLTGSLGNYPGLHIIRISAIPGGVYLDDGT